MTHCCVVTFQRRLMDTQTESPWHSSSQDSPVSHLGNRLCRCRAHRGSRCPPIRLHTVRMENVLCVGPVRFRIQFYISLSAQPDPLLLAQACRVHYHHPKCLNRFVVCLNGASHLGECTINLENDCWKSEQQTDESFIFSLDIRSSPLDGRCTQRWRGRG